MEGLSKVEEPNPALGGALPSSRSRSGAFSYFSSVINLLGGQGLCAALAVASEVCYARFLGPAPRGQISVCMMVIAFGVLLGGLGGDIPIILRTAKSTRKPAEWFPPILLAGILASCVTAGTWLEIYWKWRPKPLQGITPTLALLVATTIPAAVIGGYLLALVTGAERFRLKAGLTVADQFVGLAGFLTLLFLSRRNAEAAVAGNLIGTVAGALLTAFAVRSVLSGVRGVSLADPELHAGLRMGMQGQFANLAGFLYYRVDVLFVNYFLGPGQVGLYSLGVVVSEALWQIPQAAASALFPRTARTFDIRGANEFTCLIIRQILILSTLLGLAIAISSPILIPWIFGAQFRPSVAVVWWILPGTITLSLAKVAGADLAGRRKIAYNSTFAAISLLVTLALDRFMIPRMGIRGAALASSVAYFTDSALLLLALRHELKVTWRALLVPSVGEWNSYRRAWQVCKDWLLPAPGVQD